MKKNPQSPFETLSEEKLDEYLSLMEHNFSDDDAKQLTKKIIKKERNSIISEKKYKQKKTSFVLLAAFIMFILIPGTVFAANEIWKIQLQKNGYSSKLSITNTSSEKKQEDKNYRLELGYLPEGWEPMPHNEEDIPDKFWNRSSNEDTSVSTQLYRVKNTQEFETRYTQSSEELRLNGRQTWIFSLSGKEDSAMDREAYTLFEEEGIVLWIGTSKVLTDEEFKKIISDARIIETEPNQASSLITPISTEDIDDGADGHWLYVEDPDGKSIKLAPGEEMPKWKLKVDNAKTKGLKEQIFSYLPDIETGEDNIKIGQTVNQVDVYKSSEGIIDWNEYPDEKERLIHDKVMDENGKFSPLEVKTYQRGNGTTSVDKLISTETLPLELVKVTMTVENLSSSDLTDFSFQPSLHVLKKKDGFFYEKYEEESFEYFTLPANYSKSNSADLFALSPHGEGKSYYNMGNFSKHSKKEVTFFFVIPEKDRNDVFYEGISYGSSDRGKERIQLFTNNSN